MVDSVVFESFILESIVGVFVFERDGDGGSENGGSNVRSGQSRGLLACAGGCLSPCPHGAAATHGASVP